MRILVTNDDGINAEGLCVLESIARTLSDDVWVVAPDTEQSGAAHSLTLRLPIRSRKIEEKRYAIHGTPTDCVLVASRALLDKKPDLVLSGINYGGNLGDDVTYSGTVAAAMEGALLDIPAIALSQVIGDTTHTDWRFVKQYGAVLIQQILSAGIGPNSLVNINFPPSHIARCNGVRVVTQGNRKIGDNIHAMQDPEGNPVYWIGRKQSDDSPPPDSDYAAIDTHYIAVTPIHLDLTHFPSMARLKPLETLILGDSV